MSYDIHDGPMDEPLHESEDNINPWVLKTVNGAKECNRKENDPDKATRTFINKTALSIQEEIEAELNAQEERKEEKEESPIIPSYYIAASIKDDMKKEEKNEDFER